MITAARIAETFGIDPIIVLDAPKSEWILRIAAMNVIGSDREKAAKENESKSAKST